MIRTLPNICFFLLLLQSVSSYGQYIPPNRNDLRLVKNLEGFVSIAMPWLEDQSAQSSAINAIESKYEKVQSLLEWSPESGYLIRVRVETNTISGASTPMTPEFLGLGKQPSQVLINYYSDPTITTAPSTSPMMRLDNSKSFYVWIENKKGFLGLGKTKLKYGLISSEFYSAMNKEALRVSSNNDLRNAFQVAQSSHLFKDVMNTLKRKATDRQAKANLLEIEYNIANTQNSIRTLKSELNKTLDEINQADKALETIRTLQTIVSVATLALQVQSALQNVPDSDITNARTADELIEITETYTHSLRTQQTKYERNIKTNMDTFMKQRENLDKIFKPNNVPSEITSEIFLY